jgi:predicted homoserine dehydrogenase-like protein
MPIHETKQFTGIIKMELYHRLRQLEAEGKQVRVGLVGCGQMGSGLVHVLARTPGMSSAAISDIDLQRPLEVLKELGLTETEICQTNHVGEAEDGLRRGKFIVTEDASLLPQLPSLHTVVEATGDTEIGARIAWSCILNKKNVVMLNVETDVTVGYILNRMAHQAGSVYTVASGDEPAVCKMLYDFACSLGFEVVCLGKGKNNVIDYAATPDSCFEEAASKNMNPKMLASFKDGTKTMVEMAAVSNATGLVPDVPGMHGPKVELPDLWRVFVPTEAGGILNRKGCVEYSTGAIAPGVFAIVTTEDPRIQADMKFVSMGPGPYYQLLRPFHLCNIETPIAIAEAALYGETTAVANQMVSEVVTVAKRDLHTGEILGGIGSADVFHRLYSYQEACMLGALPMGIAPGARVLQDIPKGEVVTEDAVSPDTSRLVYQLRQMQDFTLASEKL